MLNFPESNPKKFDISILPAELKTNWCIYMTLRSDAIVKHAGDYANQFCKDKKQWSDFFDHASREWCALNSLDFVWLPDAPARLIHAELHKARELIEAFNRG